MSPLGSAADLLLCFCVVSTSQLDALSPAARISGGNVGEVYRLDDGRVLKLLRRDLVDDAEVHARFVAEASVQRTVCSPQVPTVFEVGENEGRPYFVMSFVPGRSLARLLAEEHSLPARLIGQGFLDALGDCHAHGVVHRDVKPDNVVVSFADELRVSLVDFGVAGRTRPVAEAGQPVAQTTVQLGSPWAWGPERLLGSDGVEVSSDIFSSGILLYTLVARAHPFAHGTPRWAELLARCEVPPLRAFAPQAAPLDGFFRTALAKAPGERFSSAALMSRAWLSACASAPTL